MCYSLLVVTVINKVKDELEKDSTSVGNLKIMDHNVGIIETVGRA